MPCLKILTNLPRSQIPCDFVNKIIPLLSKAVNKPPEICKIKVGLKYVEYEDRESPEKEKDKFICVISSDCEMSFGGESSCPGVVATLESIGNLGLKENKVITKEVTDFVQNELGIAQRHIFLTFYDVKGQDVAQDGKTFAK